MATMDMDTKALIFTAGQQDRFGRVWPLAVYGTSPARYSICLARNVSPHVHAVQAQPQRSASPPGPARSPPPRGDRVGPFCLPGSRTGHLAVATKTVAPHHYTVSEGSQRTRPGARALNPRPHRPTPTE